MKKQICHHLLEIESMMFPNELVCEECIKSGSRWVHLRTCQTCGKTHCCDSSPNKHATKHFQQSAHPVVISAEKGERWMWCYTDESIKSY